MGFILSQNWIFWGGTLGNRWFILLAVRDPSQRKSIELRHTGRVNSQRAGPIIFSISVDQAITSSFNWQPWFPQIMCTLDNTELYWYIFIFSVCQVHYSGAGLEESGRGKTDNNGDPRINFANNSAGDQLKLKLKCWLDTKRSVKIKTIEWQRLVGRVEAVFTSTKIRLVSFFLFYLTRSSFQSYQSLVYYQYQA